MLGNVQMESNVVYASVFLDLSGYIFKTLIPGCAFIFIVCDAYKTLKYLFLSHFHCGVASANGSLLCLVGFHVRNVLLNLSCLEE